MSTISLLTLILMVLMILVGGKSGFTSFLSVVFNFLILFAAVILITGGISAIGVTFFAGVCILAITIFMGNKNETSTNTAFVATLIVMVIMLLLIVPLDYFETILISTTVLSTLGAIAEAAVAISSGLEELSEQNPGITIAEIFKSGRTIGFQIMGMTFNTLFFGMFGGDLALFILLYKLNANFGYYLNSKIFVGECMAVLYSAVAVILVIWITTYQKG